MRKDDKIFKPISLLPIKQRREILSVKILRIVLTISSFVLVIAAMFFVITPLMNLSKNQEIDKVESQITMIRDQIRGMQKYEEVYNKNRSYQEILIKAMGTNPEWDKILTVLIDSMPITIQMQGIEQVKDPTLTAPTESVDNVTTPADGQGESAKKLLINCLVTNLSNFDYWMQKISAHSELFAEVTSGKVTGNQYGYTIDVTITLKNSVPYKVEGEVIVK